VIDQDCQLERFQALKLKVFQLKDQTEEYNQVSPIGSSSTIRTQVELFGPKLE
jgi:hypothetical protein